MPLKTIQNIFSKAKNKIQSKQKTTYKQKQIPIPIKIDHREKTSLVPAILIQKKQKHNINLKIEFKQLEIADYIINNLAIERKTFSDFASSIINKRLATQLIEIKKYPKQLLIVEGKIDYKNSRIHENALRGMLLSTILDSQVPIIFAKNQEETAKFIFTIIKKLQKNPQEFSLRQSKTFKTIKQQKQFILEGFPDIGPTKAKNLLKEFKTLKNIFNTPQEQLEKILGKKSTQFKELLEK